MDQHIEVAVVVTNKDGSRTATVLHNKPNFLMREAGFLYSYLRTTRKEGAPPYFRFGVLDNEQAQAVAALADHTAKDHEEAMRRMVETLTPERRIEGVPDDVTLQAEKDGLI